MILAPPTRAEHAACQVWAVESRASGDSCAQSGVSEPPDRATVRAAEVRAFGSWHAAPSTGMLRPILAGMVALAPEAAAPSWWDAPDVCPDAATMRARIDALVPEGKVAATGRVQIEQGPDGAVATITIDRDGGGETRVIEGESCEAIADAVALVFAIGSQSATEPARREPIVPDADPTPTASDDPLAAAPTTSMPPVAAPRRAPRRPMPSRVAVWAAGGLTLRLVPAIGPTIAGGVAIVGDRWRAELAAIGTTPTRRTLPEPNDSVRAEVSSGVGSIRGAYVPTWRTIELPIHGGIDLGAASAISRGATGATRRAGLLAALQAGVGLAWAPLPALALKIEVAGVLALARPRFAVHTPTADAIAFAAPWLGVRALAGVEGRIPLPGRSK